MKSGYEVCVYVREQGVGGCDFPKFNILVVK